MSAKAVPFDQQLQLILECRKSGLTDSQWCIEHDINPGTFYNWVKRHRQNASAEIPAPFNRQTRPAVTRTQEVVRVEPVQLRPVDKEEPVEFTSMMQQPDVSCVTTMEISINGTVLKVTNDINPGLLAQTLRVLKGLSC